MNKDKEKKLIDYLYMIGEMLRQRRISIYEVEEMLWLKYNKRDDLETDEIDTEFYEVDDQYLIEFFKEEMTLTLYKRIDMLPEEVKNNCSKYDYGKFTYYECSEQEDKNKFYLVIGDKVYEEVYSYQVD